MNDTPPEAAEVYTGRYPHVSAWPAEVARTISRATLLLKIYLLGPLLVGLILGLVIGASTSGTFTISPAALTAIYIANFALGIVATAIFFLGSWRLSVPLAEPASPAAPLPAGNDQPRRALRIVVVALIAVYAISLIAGIADLILNGVPAAGAPPQLTGIGVVTVIAGLLNAAVAAAWYGILAWHLSHLAESIDNAKAHRRATTAIWLWPVLSTVGILACGLGPLITLVLAYNLLTVFRKALIIETQALNPAPI